MSVLGDPEIVALQTQCRQAVRDAVNRRSRKPFHWGGLAGYHQLEAIGQALKELSGPDEETTYLPGIARQVERALEKNRSAVIDLEAAHTWLRRIADCLRYPPREDEITGLTGKQVVAEMEALMRQFRPDLKRQPAQAALYHAWRRHWKAYGEHLVHCYDIPGLPPDNLEMEALFNRLRCHQRRVSGRSSTKELRDLGQYQVLARAESEEDLLRRLRAVPLAEYQAQRQKMQTPETPDQTLRRLHHDPTKSMKLFVERYTARRTQLRLASADRDPNCSIHTD